MYLLFNTAKVKQIFSCKKTYILKNKNGNWHTNSAILSALIHKGNKVYINL